MTWEYIAGFIDGEGTIVQRDKVYNLYISQTNLEVLEEIRDFAGVGKVYEINQRKEHWKEAWIYNAGGGYGTEHILSNVKDLLIVKRDWALYVLGELRKRLQEIEAEKILRQERMERAKFLRSQGWTYRKIAKELGTDFGYIRKLVLFGE